MMILILLIAELYIRSSLSFNSEHIINEIIFIMKTFALCTLVASLAFYTLAGKTKLDNDKTMAKK